MRISRWALVGCCLSTLTLTSCTPPPPYTDDPAGATTAPAKLTRAFGETAEVVTRDVRYGVPVVWDVGVAKPKRISATPTFPEAICFAVTMVPTEVGTHPVDVTVMMPQFTAIAGEENANYLEDASLCGKHDPPHGYTGDLEVGHPYTFYVASWDGLYGIPATGVRLSAETQTVTWQ